MRFLFFAILIFIVSVQVQAQEFQLAGVEYYNYAPVNFKEAPGNTQLSFEEFGFYINVPKVLTKDSSTVVINGFVYAQVKAKVFDEQLGNRNVKDYHKITYRLAYVKKMRNNWNAALTLAPTLASDFVQNLNWDDFMIQASGTLTKEINKDFSVGFGIAYTTALGVPLPIPVSILRYQKGRNHFQSVLPQMVSYTYDLLPDEQLKIGFKGELNGALFNTDFSNSSLNFTVDHVNYSRANLGATLSYRLLKFLKIEAFGGFSTFRRYRLNDEHGNDYEFNSKSNAFFNIGIGLVPPKRTNK